MGANLASDKTEKDHNALTNLTTKWSWIGGVRINSSDVFRYLDGTEVGMKSPNWLKGQPNDPDKQCLGLNYVKGKWDDYTCTDRKPFICEIVDKTTTSTTTTTMKTVHTESTTESNENCVSGLVLAATIPTGICIILVIAAVLFLMKTMRKSQQVDVAQTVPNSAEPAELALTSSVLPNGRPKRQEDLLYQNNEDTGEQYYGRLGNYNSREYDDLELEH